MLSLFSSCSSFVSFSFFIFFIFFFFLFFSQDSPSGRPLGGATYHWKMGKKMFALFIWFFTVFGGRTKEFLVATSINPCPSIIQCRKWPMLSFKNLGLTDQLTNHEVHYQLTNLQTSPHENQEKWSRAREPLTIWCLWATLWFAHL